MAQVLWFLVWMEGRNYSQLYSSVVVLKGAAVSCWLGMDACLHISVLDQASMDREIPAVASNQSWSAMHSF